MPKYARKEKACFFSATFVLTQRVSCKVFTTMSRDTAPFIELVLVGGTDRGHVKGCLHLMLDGTEDTEDYIIGEIVDTLEAKIEMFSPASLLSIEFEEVTVVSARASRKLG